MPSNLQKDMDIMKGLAIGVDGMLEHLANAMCPEGVPYEKLPTEARIIKKLAPDAKRLRDMVFNFTNIIMGGLQS